MKSKLKRLTASTLALLMVGTGLPQGSVFDGLFEDSVIIANAEDQVIYDLIGEVPIVDGGQATNLSGNKDYGNLVDGNTNTLYELTEGTPYVEFHYSRAFVPKKYVLWNLDDTYYSYYRRNPSSWTIKAKLNKTDEWTTIATATNSGSNQLPTNDIRSKEYSIEDNMNAYRYFRFEATPGNAGFLLSELQFKEVSEKIDVSWRMEGGLSQAKGLSETNNTNCVINGNTAELMTDSHTKTMRYTWNSGTGLFWSNSISERYSSFGYASFNNPLSSGCVVTFPNIKGKVTGLKMTNLVFQHDPGIPEIIKMYVGTKNGNNTSLMQINGNDYLESKSDGVPFTANFTSVGIDVDENNPLTIWFECDQDIGNTVFSFSGSYHPTYGRTNSILTLSYVPAAEPDAGHSFDSSNISVNDNVLTATCNSDDADHNALYGGANHKYTLTLNAEDGVFSYYSPSTAFSATLTPSLTDFNTDTQLNATCTFNYHNNDTGADNTSPPRSVGNYTVTATIKINGTDYVMSKDFQVAEGKMVFNDYQQFSLTPKGGVEGDTITIAFTPKMGESVEALTVTGDNTSLSLGNGITDNGDNTYTFTMPNENVTIGATFNFPANSNFTQDGNTYIIKNADGWDYFCQIMQYDASLDAFNGKTVELADNITVSTMAGTTHPFKGTFDGKGKTLTFNRTADAMYTAPFQNINGATIRNLHVTGLIEGGVNSYLGGLVGSSEGNLNIENCHVSTQISTTFDSNTLSANVGIGGIVGYIHYTTYGQECRITGTVYDGLIYNPNYSGTTYGCGGFIGCLSEYAYVDLTDCLFIEGQYDNNGGRHELLWGHDNNKNSTFFHRINNQGQGKLTNCFYVGTRGLKQGSPAVESTDAPTNFAHFGDPTTAYGFLKVYGHTMVFDGKYYTPTYGDLVETYDYGGGKSYNIVYDDKPLGIPDITTELWVPLLRYKRTFTNGKPVTVMMPFNFTKSSFKKSGSSDGLTGHFYEFQGLQLSTETSKWEPKLTKEVTTMKANTPYIYVPDDEPEYWYIDNGGSGVNIFTEGYDGGNKTVTDEYGLWTLTGAYEPKSFTSADFNIMVLNDDGELGEVTGATTVAPTSGYFVRDNSAYSVNVSPAIGGIVTADPLYAKENDTVTLTVTPNAGYAVKRVWVDGDEITPVDGVYSFTMPDSNVTVTAEFEAIGYTISKTADHGTISAKVGDAIATTANYGESVTLDVIPDTGYTVKSVKVGNTEIEPVNGVYSFTMPADNVTVTAEFEAITYSVAFNKNSNDATGSMDNQSFTGGTAQDLTANGFTAPTGYHFAGWATSANGAVEYADGAEVSNLTAVNNDTVTLYAKWEANKHTVTYKVDGEVYGAVDTVAYGTALTAREAPTKTGYTFSGWSEIPATMPDEDVVITGSFIINKYAVTWKNGDTTLETDTNVPYGIAPSYDGATPTKAATAQYSYTFSGWSDGTNTYAANALPTVSGNVTYTAQFNSTAKTYTITYKVDGEVYDTKTVSYGDSIALIDAPTREGYTFSGWQTSYTTMPASNIEITGTFAINTYAVTYMVDGAQYGDSATVEHGTKLTAPEAPTKNGAIFLGWTADGVNAYDFETPVTAETTLTAMWLDASGFITFSEGYAVTDNTYNGTDRDYVGFRFAVNMDNSNYTVVQHGILYGMNIAAFSDGKADANLRFTDEEATALMDKVREFAAQNTDTETTDWIEVYIGDRRDGVVYARGFIIVTDGTNNYLIYSDVQEGSYNSFSE